MSAALQAAAELERRARCAAGNRVGVLIRAIDGNGWRWQGELIDDGQAAQMCQTFRGQLVVVERRPSLPSWRQ